MSAAHRRTRRRRRRRRRSIGLACAWRARQRGLSVTLLERDSARRGDLPRRRRDARAGRRGRVRRGRAGACWSWGCARPSCGRRSPPSWSEARGIEVGLRRTGTLLVARDEDEARELERQIAFRESLGLRAERLRPSEAREREPALAPTVRLALEAPEDHTVDPRLVLAALRRACERAGVQLREHAPVARVELDGASRARDAASCCARRRARARRPASCSPRAPGAAQIGACPQHARVPVRPVKGQILRLRDPAGPGLLRASCASRAATSFRAATAATCSARPSRSAASSWRRPPAASTSCCATPTSSCPAQRARDRGALRRAAPGHPRQRARDRRRARSRA